MIWWLRESLGFLGYILNFIAIIHLARKSKSSWSIRLTANIVVLAFNVWKMSPANIFGSVGFLGANIYGFIKWRQDDRKDSAK